MAHSVAIAALAPLADALALTAAEREREFFVWLGARSGSAAFGVAGTLVAGQLVSALGLASTSWRAG